MMSQIWKRTLSFLGLVEEYDDEYADVPEDAAPPQRAPEPRPEPSNVRRIAPAPSPGRPGVGPGDRGGAGEPHSNVRPVTSGKVHVTNPTTFNDVEEVGENFRNGVPVIMNLGSASEAVAKRMLDFASGLIYGLDGRIERAGDRVFLLTPAGTDVSTEERRRLSERGFFNQA
ncbi:MAG: cell division protein SepF [Egibacteraceae bacterium]|jgi:cell division inhibitor SepF